MNWRNEEQFDKPTNATKGNASGVSVHEVSDGGACVGAFGGACGGTLGAAATPWDRARNQHIISMARPRDDASGTSSRTFLQAGGGGCSFLSHCAWGGEVRGLGSCVCHARAARDSGRALARLVCAHRHVSTVIGLLRRAELLGARLERLLNLGRSPGR